MEYLYYKDKKGNFGDDLNYWLWPKLFGAENAKDNISFLGIGTILYNDNPFLSGLSNKKKIVFGTGIRPSFRNFRLDNTWDIRFLRGPLSANVFNNEYEYIADAAYALSLVPGFDALLQTEKKYEVSFMPYFRSEPYFNWKELCEQLGFNYISPFCEQGVEHTLKEISASKTIITEAMHGAIIADIFRVPWRRFVLSTPMTEGGMVSEFKWNDWLHSISLMNTESQYVKMFKKSLPHKIVDRLSFKTINAQFFIKKVVQREILKELSNKEPYYLSKDSTLMQINDRMNDKIQILAKDLEVLKYQEEL